MDDVLYLNNKIKSEDYLTEAKEEYLAKATSTGYFTHDFPIQTLTKSNEKNSSAVISDSEW